MKCNATVKDKERGSRSASNLSCSPWQITFSVPLFLPNYSICEPFKALQNNAFCKSTVSNLLYLLFQRVGFPPD